jgi:group I intron endonuclease
MSNIIAKNTIYALKNKINNKIYIGQTWRTPEERMRDNYVSCLKIYNAIKKHGKDNFYYEILSICYDQKNADILESYFIKKYDTIKNGYNICLGGANGVMKGRKHTDEAKAKISNASKNISDETRIKRSESLFGKNNPFYGKKHTDDTKAKISLASKGRPSATKGIPLTDDRKKQISKTLTGKKQSQETIDKRSKKLTHYFGNEDEVCNKYISGNTLLQLSKEYNCSTTPIRHCLLRNNVIIRNVQDYNSVKATQFKGNK